MAVGVSDIRQVTGDTQNMTGDTRNLIKFFLYWCYCTHTLIDSMYTRFKQIYANLPGPPSLARLILGQIKLTKCYFKNLPETFIGCRHEQIS